MLRKDGHETPYRMPVRTAEVLAGSICCSGMLTLLFGRQRWIRLTFCRPLVGQSDLGLSHRVSATARCLGACPSSRSSQDLTRHRWNQQPSLCHPPVCAIFEDCLCNNKTASSALRVSSRRQLLIWSRFLTETERRNHGISSQSRRTRRLQNSESCCAAIMAPPGAVVSPYSVPDGHHAPKTLTLLPPTEGSCVIASERSRKTSLSGPSAWHSHLRDPDPSLPVLSSFSITVFGCETGYEDVYPSDKSRG